MEKDKRHLAVKVSSKLKMTKTKKEVLAFIPLRHGSKRIPNKNFRDFLGKPLLAYTIEQSLNSRLINRTVVCTESKTIADIAKKFGAEVPFLRPRSLGSDKSDVVNSLFYTLKRLKNEENYIPTYVVILQSTSPLRIQQDIEDCFRLMDKTGATTVLTVAPTHPKFYHLGKSNKLILVNGSEKKTSRTQSWPKGYLLNGCVVYVVKVDALYREERIITNNTRAVVMPKWRSVDLDEIEDWVTAEIFYKNRNFITKRIAQLKNE